MVSINYPGWGGGGNPLAIVDAFNSSFDRSRAERDERASISAFGQLMQGLPQDQQPLSLASLAPMAHQQNQQTYAPPPAVDPSTARIRSALGETQTGGSVPQIGQMRQYIAQAALQRGIDPGVAIRVAESEGLSPGVWQSNFSKNGSREPSYGPFQLLVGGGETGYPAGMGNDFQSQTGLDPSDPSNWQKTVDFALDGAAKNGWGAWYGAAKAGIGNRQGIGGAPQQKAAPVQSADASGEQLTPLPDAGTMQALFAAPGTRPLAIALAKSRLEARGGDPMKRIEYEIAVEKLNQLRSGGNNDYAQRARAAQEYGLDPRSDAGRNFILSGDLPEARGGAAELGLNPQYGLDQSGNPVLIQIGKDGKAVQTAMPEGVTLAKEPIRLDAGTHFVLLDPITRQPVGQIPKDLAGAEQQKAIGENQGKQIAAAPADIQGAQNAIDLIAGIRSDPYLNRGTGFSSLGNSVPGTGGYDFQNKVEQAKSGAFLTAIQQMRGLGALSNAEGSAATAAVNRMDTATSKEAFLSALHDYEKLVRQGMDRAQKRLGAPAVQGQPGKINSQDEFNALPSGAEFIAPDGSVRRKP